MDGDPLQVKVIVEKDSLAMNKKLDILISFTHHILINRKLKTAQMSYKPLGKRFVSVLSKEKRATFATI